MRIGILTLVFQLEGCASLKEKRQRLAGLRDRFGRQPNIAVCESGEQDALRRAEWSFVAAARSRQLVDQLLAGVENHVAQEIDARVLERRLEHL
jgi:hypothetical protein